MTFQALLGIPASRHWLRLPFFPLQVEKKLPLLKAIVQYNEEIKEKRPNLYSVSPVRPGPDACRELALWPASSSFPL